MQQDLADFEIPQAEIEQLTGIPEVGKTLSKEEYDKLWKETYDNEVNSKCRSAGALTFFLVIFGGAFLGIALATALGHVAGAFSFVFTMIGGLVGLLIMENNCREKYAHDITNTVNQYMTTYQDNYNNRYNSSAYSQRPIERDRKIPPSGQGTGL